MAQMTEMSQQKNRSTQKSPTKYFLDAAISRKKTNLPQKATFYRSKLETRVEKVESNSCFSCKTPYSSLTKCKRLEIFQCKWRNRSGKNEA